MTVLVENHTGFPHAIVEKWGPSGEPLDILVVRATFDFSANDEIVILSKRQSPIVWGEEFDGPISTSPKRAIVLCDGDLSPYKPGTDIHVIGTAQAPGGHPHKTWQAAVAVGKHCKSIQLYGPRWFRRKLFGWRLEEAQPTTQVKLDYRLAYGGLFEFESAAEKRRIQITHPGNPAGCGWLPDDRVLDKYDRRTRKKVLAYIDRLDSLAAPQIESPFEPVRHPAQHTRTQGLGPIAPWCQPRLGLQGTLDKRWLETRHPNPPEDFDPRFFQSAHPDLIITPHLRGDEPLALAGLARESMLRMQLPGWMLIPVAKFESGRVAISQPLLDTLTIDLDTRRLGLVWRTSFSRTDPVREITIGCSALPHAREGAVFV